MTVQTSASRILIGCRDRDQSCYLERLLTSWGNTLETRLDGQMILRRAARV